MLDDVDCERSMILSVMYHDAEIDIDKELVRSALRDIVEVLDSDEPSAELDTVTLGFSVRVELLFGESVATSDKDGVTVSIPSVAVNVDV
jgi:hypothetical protein